MSDRQKSPLETIYMLELCKKETSWLRYGLDAFLTFLLFIRMMLGICHSLIFLFFPIIFYSTLSSWKIKIEDMVESILSVQWS